MTLVDHVNNSLQIPVFWYRIMDREAVQLDNFALVSQVGVVEQGTKDQLIYEGRLRVEVYKKFQEDITIEWYVNLLKPVVDFIPDDCFIYEVMQGDRQSIQLGTTAWVVTRIQIKFAKII
jgi:hypothetical protein